MATIQISVELRMCCLCVFSITKIYLEKNSNNIGEIVKFKLWNLNLININIKRNFLSKVKLSRKNEIVFLMM